VKTLRRDVLETFSDYQEHGLLPKSIDRLLVTMYAEVETASADIDDEDDFRAMLKEKLRAALGAVDDALTSLVSAAPHFAKPGCTANTSSRGLM
jgi:hypothetical protein